MPRRFQFQRFFIDDSRSAMKIGMDGVLLGAWAPVTQAQRIVDLGTGCGLIALMLAQRTESQSSTIVAVELEEKAAIQAVENVKASDWSGRIEVLNESWQSFTTSVCERKHADLIVCNPPYFGSPNSDSSDERNIARHDTYLKPQEIFAGAVRILDTYGRICLIVPHAGSSAFEAAAASNGLFLTRKTCVRSLPERPFHRCLVEFCKMEMDSIQNELTLEISHHQFSSEFAELTKDFYLRFASDQDSASMNK